MSRKMKDSGIEWIGEIPEEWDCCRFGRYIRVLTDYTANGSFGDLAKNVIYFDEENYARLVRLTDLRVNFENSGVYVSEEAYNYLSKSSLFGGELLIANVGAYAGYVCEMPFVNYKTTLAPNMMLIKFDLNKCVHHYIYYLYQSSNVFEQLYLKANSTSAQPKLNKNDVRSVYGIFPPLEDQIKISNYLDSRCTLIDKTIEKQKQVIEKLKEYKQSVITEAVTKGLNPSVPMKNSGIEWIGEIPEHWNTKIGKYLLKKENREVKENYEVITCFRDGEVTLRKYRREEGFTFADKEIGYQGIIAGDLVIHGMDGFAGAIGISDSDGKGSPVLNVCTSYGELDVNFARYYLRMLASQNVFIALATGIRERSCDLRWNKIASLPFVLPKLDEQKKICCYLEKVGLDVSLLVNKKEQYIFKLESYKKSLIYECVTGKREVK